MAALRKNMHLLKKLNVVSSCVCKPASLKHLHTSAPVLSVGDPLHYFMRDDVQKILEELTGFDVKKTFYQRAQYANKEPNYKVLSDVELEEEIEKAKEIKARRLQMPPFMDIRKPKDDLLSDDPDIAPALTSKYVFIDISDNLRRIPVESKRNVVCRHEDGKLKVADWEQSDRVVRMYYPVAGRNVFIPKMFEEEQLEKILTHENYIDILERACVQFEPDSSDFIRITHRIYEHIAQNGDFDVLHCTRFYGPMVFYFAWFNKIEPLLMHMMNNDHLTSAVHLINLKCMLHKEPSKSGNLFMIIRDYCLGKVKKEYKKDLKIALNDLEKRLEIRAKRMESEAKESNKEKVTG
ncbi:28S ribosomal protein S22 [Mactra antiquata]